MRKVLYLFGQLDDGDVEWLTETGHTQNVAPNEAIIIQDEPVDALFILLRGGLSVYLGSGGGEREIARLGVGEIVGEMSFVDARPPSATVRAQDEGIVFAISRAALNAKLAADMGFAARFYKALAIYLSTTVRERHRALGFGSEEDLATLAEEDTEFDELDPNILDTLALAGDRFDRMLKELLED
ncbi:MAG: cyclic nucleotide-binding domain-containing protein [Acidobacteriota bacterium]